MKIVNERETQKKANKKTNKEQRGIKAIVKR